MQLGNAIKRFRYKSQCSNEWPHHVGFYNGISHRRPRVNPLDSGGKYHYKNLHGESFSNSH